MTGRTTSSATVLACWDPAADKSPAVQWAARTARAHHRRLVLYTSFAKLRETLPPEAYLDARRTHEARVQAFIEQTGASGLETHAALSNDDIRVDLFDTADRWGSELLVAGVEGRSSGPGFLRLGSVTEFLAHHTDRPLVIIRSPFDEHDHLAVLVDGTADGVAAVRWAATHASATGSEVSPVVVDAGSAATNQLATAAEAEGATLLVVGAPAVRERLGRRVGGTALKILHGTDRSIAIVPHAKDAAMAQDHQNDSRAD